MQKRELQRHVDTLINGWILKLRKSPYSTHLDDDYWGAYFWNEREYQWSLFSHMREYAGRERLGSKWAVHAEGSIERPRYARGGRKRHDIVVINHSGLRRWWKRGRSTESDYPIEVAIEFKRTWNGSRSTERAIKSDIKKLDGAVTSGSVKVGYLVWFDQIRSNGPKEGLPFFSQDKVQQLRANTRARVVHWPDGNIPIASRQDIRDSKPGFYP